MMCSGDTTWSAFWITRQMEGAAYDDARFAAEFLLVLA